MDAERRRAGLRGWGFLAVGLIIGFITAVAAMGMGLFDPRATIVDETSKDSGKRPIEIADEWGHFSGTPKVELLSGGRNLRLTEDFAYVDPSKKTWAAPKDSVVDGASIPKLFRSIIGGPLEGQYRNASIIHDVGCERMAERWQDVHLAFYNACRCGGVGAYEAKILYTAVYHFGPRWEQKVVMMTQNVERPDGKIETLTVPKHVGTRLEVLRPSERNVEEVKEYLKQNPNATLEDLQKLFPTAQ
jgi:hypothetical protein